MDDNNMPRTNDLNCANTACDSYAALDTSTRDSTSSNKNGATSEQWDRHRHLIEKLYINDGRTLAEVRTIMDREHGLKATVNMYKKRINKWNIGKNCRSEEMVAIARQKVERDAVRKASTFEIRGKRVNIDEVLRYFKRRGYDSLEEVAAETKSLQPMSPSDVRCWTPGSLGTLKSDDGVHPGEATSENRDKVLILQRMVTGQKSSLRKQTRRCRQSSSETVRRQLLPISRNRRCLSSLYSMLLPIAPPDVLLIPERILSTIDSLVCHSISSIDKFWNITEDQTQVVRTSTGGSPTVRPAIWDFQAFCNAAMRFLIQDMFVEARQVLAKACERISDVLEQAHPSTVFTLFRIYFWFNQHGYTDAIIKVLEHFRSLASTKIASTHLFYQFAKDVLLMEGYLRNEYSVFGKYCIDAIERYSHLLGWALLGLRLCFMYDLGKSNGWREAERQMTRFAAGHKRDGGLSNSTYCRILLNLAQVLRAQGRFREAEANLQIVVDHYIGQKIHVSFAIEALEVIAHIQHHQAKHDQARANLERCIELTIEHNGSNYCWIVKQLLTLKEWLQESGRYNEADIIASRISEWLGSPVIAELSK